MAQFHEQSFARRFGQMGDEAEKVFEAVYPQGFARFGLNRPPINLTNIPPFVRFMPDYLTAKGLVEVQGFGTDQIAKFKVQKLDVLRQWHRLFRVDFFLWDRTNLRYGWLRLNDLEEAMPWIHAELRSFHEGNQYWAIPAANLPVIEWVGSGGDLGAAR